MNARNNPWIAQPLASAIAACGYFSSFVRYMLNEYKKQDARKCEVFDQG
jgi:hypothetical protein